MIPKDKEIKEAVEVISKTLPCIDDAEERYEIEILLNLSKSYLQASDGLPEKKEEYHDLTATDWANNGFNECLSIVKPIVAQKDKEISELVSALEFCIGKEVFPQGVCECDKETEAYTKAKQVLNKHKTINE